MEAEERIWIDEAITLCSAASNKSILIVIIRRQDANDGADVVITNATDPKVIRALMASGSDNDGDEE